MIIYLAAKTTCPDLIIDYIDAKLKSGEVVSLNWDESDISRSEDGFEARYKGVYFGEEYANGRLDEMADMEITDIGLYSEIDDASDFSISGMEIWDGERHLTFENIPCGNILIND